MDRSHLPLNALRAFEVAARQGSFTSAAIELRVSQAAISHQILGLEDLLGVQLFLRTPRGLLLTDEAKALFPILTESFDRIGQILDRFGDGRYRETLHLGVVNTFAVGWLLPRLGSFHAQHPGIEVRVATNNNRVDLPKEGLDMAIRFGDGRWPGLDAQPLMDAPLSPLCAPDIASDLTSPADLARHTLLRSYRADEWALWFRAAGGKTPVLDGPIFDSSVVMADVAEMGQGIALLPVPMFSARLAAHRLFRPFAVEVATGRYWLTMLSSRSESPAMRIFRDWLRTEIAEPQHKASAHGSTAWRQGSRSRPA
ncbi:LysR family transcriptional regulator [Chelativorans sp. YIM 93263]|uniref:LysR family transcriptional regulator n=1 Tax=Chelativorans sp. YIM 93263 TaxID=2906648 RepID=UPI0023781B14|nr:LysR family transcriptional regulator [Chelativorans sp. YIM 93263]